MSTLRNCPSEFYFNCSNRINRCKVCCAGNGPTQGQLFYAPIDHALLKHPYEKDQKKVIRLRQAKQVEKDVAREIVRGTIRSGAALGDGDHHLLNGTIRLEVKDRGERKSWNLTWEEFQKGQKQGISTYAVSVKCPDGKTRTMYMMDHDLFTQFLALLKDEQS